MIPKQRMFAAIEGQADCVPVAPPYLGLYLPYVIEQISDLTWAHLSYGGLEDRVRWESIAYEALGCDWIIAHAHEPLEALEGKHLEREDGVLLAVDDRDGSVRALPTTRPAPPPVVPTGTIAVEDVAHFPPPPTAEERIARGEFAVAQEVVRRYGDEVFIAMGLSAPFPVGYAYFGVEGMMIALKEDREVYEALIAYQERTLRETIRACAMAGVDGIWIEEWLASADMIAEADYLKFAYSGERAVIEAVREHGMIAVFYFCGDVMPRLPFIQTLEPTCLAVEESKKGFEIEIGEVRRRMGEEVCVFGNVDVLGVLQNGREDLWCREIERQVQAAGGNGRFVMSFGSPITPGTPPERVRAFVELTHRLTRV